MEIAKQILERLLNPAWVRGNVAKARMLTGGPNACAATLSLLLRELELIRKVERWTSHIVGTDNMVSPLEGQHPMLRILHPADVLPADIIASRDRNDDDNNAPDHVFVIVGKPEGKDRDNPFALVIDNYCRNGRPYWRNLGKSGWYKGAWRSKTPMAYALRFVEPAIVAKDTELARRQIVNALAGIYKAASKADLSQPTMHYLNAFRWSAELGILEVN